MSRRTSSIGARVEGLEEARAALEKILRAERSVLPETLEVVGQVAVREVRRRAPLATGRLRRSYTHEVDGRGRWVEISSNVEYAPYQEFGTRYIVGTPHLRPGIEAVIPQIPDIVAEGMARAARAAAPSSGGGSGARGRMSRTIASLGG